MCAGSRLDTLDGTGPCDDGGGEWHGHCEEIECHTRCIWEDMSQLIIRRRIVFPAVKAEAKCQEGEWESVGLSTVCISRQRRNQRAGTIRASISTAHITPL